MNGVAIEVDGLGKRYQIAHLQDPYGRLSESVSQAVRAPLRRIRREPRETREWFWALKDVSFQIPRGDVVGVIGRNGAGKSTLLKVLSRITEPTSGTADLIGRVASLLEVGTGFHPELTGRENIFLSGSLLGMRRAEIRRRFDEIVAFAGVEQFLDTPVKRFSSGMQVRLGFAVAAHLDTEILLIDEVLSVGDAAFQRRSLGRLEDVAKQGRTAVFVSHDLGAVVNLTRTCLYLERGEVKGYGPTPEIVRSYQTDALTIRERPDHDLSYYRRSEVPEAAAQIAGLHVAAASDRHPIVEMGDSLEIRIEVDVLRRIEAMTLSIILKNERGATVAILYSPDNDFWLTASPGVSTVAVTVHDLPLVPGQYFADVGINQSALTQAADVILDFPLVEVTNTARVVQWLERPWGVVHPTRVDWR